MNKNKITVETTIKAPVKTVWACWTEPEHIINWNFASDDWCCPTAVNDLRSGGSLNWRMESKDGSIGFDFTGTYDQIRENEFISYQISDGRKVEIRFSEFENSVILSESFETETIHSVEQQRLGWQSILENFKKYVEAK